MRKEQGGQGIRLNRKALNPIKTTRLRGSLGKSLGPRRLLVDNTLRVLECYYDTISQKIKAIGRSMEQENFIHSNQKVNSQNMGLSVEKIEPGRNRELQMPEGDIGR